MKIAGLKLKNSPTSNGPSSPFCPALFCPFSPLLILLWLSLQLNLWQEQEDYKIISKYIIWMNSKREYKHHLLTSENRKAFVTLKNGEKYLCIFSLAKLHRKICTLITSAVHNLDVSKDSLIYLWESN